MPETEQKYPSIIVEVMPNWVHNFRVLKGKLGHAPNAHPFEDGVRFIPKDNTEYRIVRGYLEEITPTEKLQWYALNNDESIRVAVRGLPGNTTPEEVKEGLRELGYVPEYAIPLRATNGRSKCIFKVILRRTPDLIPGIWNVTEVLNMPGVRIELWQSKRRSTKSQDLKKYGQPFCIRCEEPYPDECCCTTSEPVTSAVCSDSQENKTCRIDTSEASKETASTEECDRASASAPYSLRVQSPDIKSTAEVTPLAPTATENTPDPDTPIGLNLASTKRRGRRKSKKTAHALGPVLPSKPIAPDGPSTLGFLNTYYKHSSQSQDPECGPEAVKAVKEFALNNIKNIINLIDDRDSKSKEVFEATLLAYSRVITYYASEKPELCEQNALEIAPLIQCLKLYKRSHMYT